MARNVGFRRRLGHEYLIWMVRSRLSARQDAFFSWAGIGLLILVWCALTYGNFVRPLFLPKPSGIFNGLLDFYHRNWLLPAFWRSFRRVSISLLLVVAIGVPVGLMMGAFSPLDALCRKIVNAAKSIPTTGIAGLIILWFGIDERGKIVFLFLGSLFYMIILTKNAVASVSEDYVAVARDLGATNSQVIWRVLIPGALPQIWEAIAVCNGIMWTYIVLAEFISASESTMGLGFLLFTGSRGNDSGKAFGMLFIIALISVVTDFTLRTIRKHVRHLNWTDEQNG